MPIRLITTPIPALKIILDRGNGVIGGTTFPLFPNQFFNTYKERAMKKYLFGLGGMLVGARLMFVLMKGEVRAEVKPEPFVLMQSS